LFRRLSRSVIEKWDGTVVTLWSDLVALKMRTGPAFWFPEQRKSHGVSMRKRLRLKTFAPLIKKWKKR